ncbi:MAG: 4'-phosphopantetheinyl transferase superfamily protein [Marmoricola sp.]
MAEVTQSGSGGAVSVVWASGSRTPGAGTELVRAEVARAVGIPVEEVRLTRSCPACGSSDHGRPVVLAEGRPALPCVSLSRAGDLVVVAVSESGSVGVDIERLVAPRFAGFDAVALHHCEPSPCLDTRAATWVRKESLLKATGDGLRVDPRHIWLSDPDQQARLLEWGAPDPPMSSVWMQDLEIEGHAACVTVLSELAPQFSLRQAVPEGLPH